MGENAFRIVEDPAKDSAVLTVLATSLEMADSGPLEARCRELLWSRRGRLSIDLSRVKHVPSTVLTVIVNTDAAARETGRSLRVRCAHLVARMLRRLVPASVEATD